MADEKKVDKKDEDDGCILFSDDILRNYGIIPVFGHFDSEKSEKVVEKLIWANGKLERHYPISLIINSYGGQTSSVFSIIDIIHSIKRSVHTYGTGNCFSAAALLLMAGEKNHRYIFSSVRIMIHNFSVYFDGNYDKFKDTQREFDSFSEYLVKFISSQTGNSTRSVRKDMKKEKYFVTPEEAIKYGVCDKIITKDILEIISENINKNVNSSDT
jgi:ATP-dependent Clp protease protease subunit